MSGRSRSSRCTWESLLGTNSTIRLRPSLREEAGDALERQVVADGEMVHHRERQQHVGRPALLQRAAARRWAQPSAGEGLVRSSSSGRMPGLVLRLHPAIVALHRRGIDVERDHAGHDLARRAAVLAGVGAEIPHGAGIEPAEEARAPPPASSADGLRRSSCCPRCSRPTRCPPASSRAPRSRPEGSAPGRPRRSRLTPRLCGAGARARVVRAPVGVPPLGQRVEVDVEQQPGPEPGAAGQQPAAEIERDALEMRPQQRRRAARPPGSSAPAAPGSARRTAGTPPRARPPHGARRRACR